MCGKAGFKHCLLSAGIASLMMLLLVSLQVRIILNKSDQVDQQQLMRVYGALMWSLGKVFKSPEVCKVGLEVHGCALFHCTQGVRVLQHQPLHFGVTVEIHYMSCMGLRLQGVGYFCTFSVINLL